MRLKPVITKQPDQVLKAATSDFQCLIYAAQFTAPARVHLTRMLKISPRVHFSNNMEFSS